MTEVPGNPSHEPQLGNRRKPDTFWVDETCRQDPGLAAGIFLDLPLIAAGTICFVATSDYLRGQLEGRASDLTGRKTPSPRLPSSGARPRM